MSIRVHELAKHCGLSTKEMIDKLHAIKYPVKTASSTVDNITAESIEKEYGYVPAPPQPVAPPPPPPPPPVEVKIPEPPKPIVEPPKPVTPPAPAPAPKPISPPPVATPKPAPVAPAPVAAPKVTVFQHAQPRPVVAPPKPAAPKATALAAPAPPAAPYIIDEKGNKVIQMKPPVVVRDLAQRIGIKPHILLGELMELNVFASVGENLGEDVAKKICQRHGFLFELERRDRGVHTIHQPKPVVAPTASGKVEDMKPRPPVVTVMGHVDHGKTSLLDAIRKTDVAAGESGGITQHIGASVVHLSDGKQITFLDTPGHQAFTKMRARGANVTDLTILVVAADDGIMPQTLEAIQHARAAKVPIIVAVNKCDLPAANPDRVKKQLQDQGLNPESWGGDTITVDVSATTKKGVDELLELILLQAEMMELRASPKASPKGNVIEAQMEPGQGCTATVLVREGTLKVGDSVIIGPYWGKLRALIDDKGKRIKEAGPSIPVKLTGLSGLPEAGAEFVVMKNDKEARELAEQRQLELRIANAGAAAPRAMNLDDLMTMAAEDEKKKLNVVLKADVQGSLEAIADSLGKLKSDKINLEILQAIVGNINENDVLLASASKAVIIGFRVKVENGVTDIAKRENVQIKLYTIIYELLEQVEKALEGLLEPESRETVIGHAEIKQVFELSKGPKVAGCVVTDGRITRSARVRLLRRRAVQYEGRIVSLKHFQDDAKEVKSGAECGLRLDNYTEFQAGDILECFTVERVAAVL